MAMQDQGYELKLLLAGINTILDPLGRRPYAELYGRYRKVRQQAQRRIPPPHLQEVGEAE